MKKRSCRRNIDERTIHERAVRVRKMTDEKLVAYLDEIAQQGQTPRQAAPEAAVTRMIDYLEGKVGSGNGIGHGIIYKLRKELENAANEGVL